MDEYQDTNRAQNALVLMLGERHRNVFVVGDADQSIYRFRGATMRNILDFEDAFEDTTVILLEQNYRSTSRNVLDAANAVIARNLGRHPKRLWTDAEQGEPITWYRATDDDDEARWVVREIRRLATDGHALSDIAVMYRNQRPEQGPGDRAERRGPPVPGDRRDRLLRPARGPRRPGLPARRGEPRRRGELEAGSERAPPRCR